MHVSVVFKQYLVGLNINELQTGTQYPVVSTYNEPHDETHFPFNITSPELQDLTQIVEFVVA